MTFMKKAELIAEAERLGIDIDGLTFAEQNKKVQTALAEEQEEPVVEPDYFNIIRQQEELIAELRSKLEEKYEPDATEMEAVPEPNSTRFKRIILAPEIGATGVQLVKYDEELGDDVTVEEVSYKDMLQMNGGLPVERDVTAGTYKIKGKSGRKVIAQSTIPKLNAGVLYDPNIHLVPLIFYKGQYGYIWTHQHYPNIKELLKASGQFQKYRHLFNASEHPENIWYAAGKMLVVDPDVVHSVFAEIEANSGR